MPGDLFLGVINAFQTLLLRCLLFKGLMCRTTQLFVSGCNFRLYKLSYGWYHVSTVPNFE